MIAMSATGMVLGADNERQIMKTKIPTATVQLPTDPSCWGHKVTQAQVVVYAFRLQCMIFRNFSDVAKLTFERTTTPFGSGIRCEDSELAEEIRKYIEDNWTAAL